ncbi:glycosyltransferase family 2 protein [Flavobacterium sp. MR2016-29]|uniref:glycosyltransferase family 2 protein n=1 Tax=Flavobacterium sp. MR2016-29 TaxID=2783795 RepID=UPI001889CC25|nr:glycosyltransferase family 2 protein [Flavobacterium sp. MR2016-29]MBF4492884.1 glycosyltransferase family 2 protein [Flavobacterium sp. MR2016-29]
MANSNFPLVSVIVPNYNHEKYLTERLNSVYNQTYHNFEVILLDDCSTDNSREILSHYAGNQKTAHCIFNKINTGNTFKQWNKGISLAKGDLIWIAESDDFCDNYFLEKLTIPFQDSEIVLSYCQSNRVNEFGDVTGTWITHTDNLNETLFLNNFSMNGNEFIRNYLIFKNVIPNASAVIFRKENAIQIGDLDLDPILKTSGDWLFYVKLLANSKIAFNHEQLNSFRYHSNSVISNFLKKDERSLIIEIELKTRKKIIKFLSDSKLYNFPDILNINRQITKDLKYEMGLLFIGNNKKVKGFLLLSTILRFSVKKFNFSKKLKMKIFKIFK